MEKPNLVRPSKVLAWDDFFFTKAALFGSATKEPPDVTRPEPRLVIVQVLAGSGGNHQQRQRKEPTE